jgi:hypothetical protein
MSSLIFSLLPLAFAFFSYLFYYTIRVIKPKSFKDTYLRNFITTNFVFIFLIYPTITNYTFGMFNCIEVEGVNYLIRDFTI